MGSPSGVHQSGTDMAGLPVMLATTAGYATVLPPTSAARMGSAVVETTSPRSGGGADIVGVSHISKCVRKSATHLENRCNSSMACRYSEADTRE